MCLRKTSSQLFCVCTKWMRDIEKENPTKREQRSIIINIKFNGFCLCAIRMKIGLGCVALWCTFTYQIQYFRGALTIRTTDDSKYFIIHTLLLRENNWNFLNILSNIFRHRMRRFFSVHPLNMANSYSPNVSLQIGFRRRHTYVRHYASIAVLSVCSLTYAIWRFIS